MARQAAKIRTLLPGLLFAACLLGSDAMAQTAEHHNDHPKYWSSEGWDVYAYDDEDMCEAAAETVSGEHFTFAYLPRSASYSFILTNANATSLRDGQSVRLMVAFIRQGEVNLDWGEQTFNVRHTGGTVAFTSPLLRSPIDRDMALSDQLGLFRYSTNGELLLVAGISLDRSAEAIEHMRQCAFEAAELNPDDPFLR